MIDPINGEEIGKEIYFETPIHQAMQSKVLNPKWKSKTLLDLSDQENKVLSKHGELSTSWQPLVFVFLKNIVVHPTSQA